jgi:hypothetical protein
LGHPHPRPPLAPLFHPPHALLIFRRTIPKLALTQ